MFDQIVEKLPELQRLEATASDLEGKHGQAQARVQALALRTGQAREHDLNAEAVALNADRRPPKPTEPALREQSEGAARDAEVLARRLALAVADRGRYLSENHGEILGLLEAAHAAEAALEALLAYHRAEDAARDLARRHPAPALENSGGPESIAVVWGALTTQNAGGGPSRGSLEGTLRHLVSLGAGTVVGAVEEGEDDDDVDAA